MRQDGAEQLDMFIAYPSLDDLATAACTVYGVSKTDLISNRRTRTICWARAEFCYRASKETLASYAKIGRAIGRNDPSYAIGAARAHRKRMARSHG